jgi:hypothetical protein
MLLYPEDERLPFPYWLAWLSQCCIKNSAGSWAELNQVATGTVDVRKTDLIKPQMQASFLTQLSYGLYQKWLYPIMDYAVPLQQVYTEIPAWKLLENPTAPELAHISQQAVIIMAGGYAAGANEPGIDAFTAPAAMRHWYIQRSPDDAYRNMVGGEYHAYAIHQLITNRFVIPIPDLWLILLAAALGKGSLLWQKHLTRLPASSRAGFRLAQPRFLLLLSGGTVLYSMLSLQLYLSSAILVPVVLPAVTYWLLIAPAFIQRKL